MNPKTAAIPKPIRNEIKSKRIVLSLAGVAMSVEKG
jgi:hypothetical protein